MKLSNRTVELLKNFGTINTGMLFLPGNEIRTISIAKNGFAKATIDEEIPQRFAIYSLPEFLSVLSLLKDAEITLHDNHMVIQSGKQKVKYYYAAENLIVSPPEGKNITLPSVDVTLTLTADVLAQIEKMAAIMKFDVISISKSGVKAFDSASNKNSSTTNMIDIEVAVDTTSDKEFRIKIDNLKMLPGDYDVEIAEAGITQFTNCADSSLIYNIPLEK
nr:MAG TPA: SLIDING CLAMP [Caudoviricetes sp.]